MMENSGPGVPRKKKTHPNMVEDITQAMNLCGEIGMIVGPGLMKLEEVQRKKGEGMENVGAMMPALVLQKMATLVALAIEILPDHPQASIEMRELGEQLKKRQDNDEDNPWSLVGD